MSHATLLWSVWQDLLGSFAWAFTRRGFRRFAEWITALALNVEEHTITQSVLALDRPADWKALESFAEYGAWRRRLRHPQPHPAWSRRPPGGPGTATTSGPSTTPRSTAAAPTSGAPAPSTSTPPAAPTGPPPCGPTTGSSWGRCCENPGKPAWFLPISGRLYFRKSQLPARSGMAGPTDEFRTKCELVVELIREQARYRPRAAPGRLRRRLRPAQRGAAAGRARGRLAPRIEFLTRLRHDARLYALPPTERPEGKRGPKPKWGRGCRRRGRGAAGPGRGTTGDAFIYGRRRKVRWKEVVCLWRVLGHDVPVKAVVAEVEGYKKRFTLVSSAVELTGLQMVELFAARFRQEDGFRDLKQRLGWEECRAWTRNPIERTSQAQWVTMSLLRLAQFRLESAGEVRLVVAAAVEQGQGPAERAGRGAAVPAACRRNSSTSLGLAGRWWEFRGRGGMSGA